MSGKIVQVCGNDYAGSTLSGSYYITQYHHSYTGYYVDYWKKYYLATLLSMLNLIWGGWLV
jgi:hypothetical protein